MRTSLGAMGERDLQHCAAGRDEMGLHADTGVGVVEAERTDHLDRSVRWGTHD